MRSLLLLSVFLARSGRNKLTLRNLWSSKHFTFWLIIRFSSFSFFYCFSVVSLASLDDSLIRLNTGLGRGSKCIAIVCPIKNSVTQLPPLPLPHFPGPCLLIYSLHTNGSMTSFDMFSIIAQYECVSMYLINAFYRINTITVLT